MKRRYISSLEDIVICCGEVRSAERRTDRIERVLIDEVVVLEVSFVTLYDKLHQYEEEQHSHSYLDRTECFQSRKKLHIDEIHDEHTHTSENVRNTAIEVPVSGKHQVGSDKSDDTHAHNQQPLSGGEIRDERAS